MQMQLRMPLMGLILAMSLLGCRDDASEIERQRSIAMIQQETARINYEAQRQAAANLERQHAHEKELQEKLSRDWTERLKYIGGLMGALTAFVTIFLGVLRYINNQQNRLQALTITAFETSRDLFIADKISEEQYVALMAKAWAHNKEHQIPGSRMRDNPRIVDQTG